MANAVAFIIHALGAALLIYILAWYIAVPLRDATMKRSKEDH